MLHLKRIVEPYEFRRCGVSDELIGYGDYYYEDDEDGLIVKASVYAKLKKKKEREEFDYTNYERAKSQVDYDQMMKQKERQFFEATVLDRKIYGKE